MKRAVTDYATLIFDCDGVVLNSNRVKTDAFFRAALPYGEAAARAFVDYHVTHGGVSRYRKFEYFLAKIVPEQAPACAGPDIDTLLQRYSDEVRQGLMSCEVAPGLMSLRELTPCAQWLIVSGGDQAELRDVFARRGLAELFDGGIFGSPNAKDEILERELLTGRIRQPGLFLGDSKYDCQVASQACLDFVFLSGWTEVKDHILWCELNGVRSLRSIEELISYV